MNSSEACRGGRLLYSTVRERVTEANRKKQEELALLDTVCLNRQKDGPEKTGVSRSRAGVAEEREVKEEDIDQRERAPEQQEYEQKRKQQGLEYGNRDVNVRGNAEGEHTDDAEQRYDDFCGSPHWGRW